MTRKYIEVVLKKSLALSGVTKEAMEHEFNQKLLRCHSVRIWCPFHSHLWSTYTSSLLCLSQNQRNQTQRNKY